MVHRALLIIKTAMLLQLFQGGYQIVGERLPEGTRIIATSLNSTRDKIYLVVEHPSFDPIDPGDIMSILPSPRLVKAWE